MDDVSDIGEFYDGHVEVEQTRLEEHQLEHDLTWRYLDRYLPERGTILEVGAATGRYTVTLAQRGYAVTAVDLSAGLLEVCKQRLAAAGVDGQVKTMVADARDLSAVTTRDYDAVLLMGPLYHLVEAADRQTALNEVLTRLRSGGVLFSAFISRYALLSDLIKRDPKWIADQAEVQSIIGRGKRADDLRRGGFRGYFVTVNEVAPLHEANGFETLVVAGVEPAIGADDASYNRLQGRERQQWLDLLYQVSTEASILGASRHLLYIGRKKA